MKKLSCTVKKEHLPNLLTFCRIVLSFFLLFLPTQSVVFALLYLICGFTDVLDGYLARKMQAETQLGAKLDSLADLCMCVLILFTVIRMTHADLMILVGIGVVFAIRAGSALLSKRKFGQMSSIHTAANKLAGLLLFFCPLAYTLMGQILIYGTGAVALLASVEELLILLASDTLNLNRKSIFSKL